MLITLPQGVPTQIVWSAAAQRNPAVKSYLVANRDETNQILIGFSGGQDQQPDLVSPDPQVTSLVDPLGSVQLGTGQDWFGMSPAASVQIDVIPNCSYWTPSPLQIAESIEPLSIAIAQQIAATGIPIIPSPTVIYNL